jgi:hypothetical protein
MIKINPFILINYPPAVEKLNNGLNGRSFKLNENIFIAELIKINFFTPYNYVYLIIKIRFKIGNFWYITKTLLSSDTERNFISQILIVQFYLTSNRRDTDKVKTLDSRHIQIYSVHQIETQARDSIKIQKMIMQEYYTAILIDIDIILGYP